MKKKIALLVLCSALSFNTVWANEIDNLESYKQMLEVQQTQTLEEIENAEAQKGEVDAEISVNEEVLIQTLASINMLEEEIQKLESEIPIVEERLAAAIAQQETQYASMKKRIQYIYETGGDMGWAMMLLSQENLSDLLNNVEYTQKMYSYDRQCLEDYINITNEVNAYRNELYEKNAELNGAKQGLEEESLYLQELISNLQSTSSAYEGIIQEAYEKVSLYQQEIEYTNNQINVEIQKQIEAERAAEEARRREEEVRQNAISSENTNSSEELGVNAPQVDYSYSYSEPSVEPSYPGNSESSESMESYFDNEDFLGPAGEEPAGGVVPSSGVGQQVVNYALQFVGCPYVYGGNSLTGGIDCSGFTQQVWAAFGYYIPRSSAAQRTAGYAVTADELQPGDIVCYAGHVALYIGGGAIVHASNEQVGIIVSESYNYRPVLGFRRIA